MLTLHFFSRVALNLNNLILTRLLTQIGNGFEAVQLWSDHKDVFSLLGVKRICMCVCPENVAPLAITMVTNGRSSQYTLYYHLSLSPTHTHTLSCQVSHITGSLQTELLSLCMRATL